MVSVASRQLPVLRRDVPPSRWLAFGAIALLVHLVTAAFLAQLPSRTRPEAQASPRPALQMSTLFEPAPRPQPEAEEEPMHHTALPEPEREVRPEQARFEDQFDRQTEREQVAAVQPARPATPPAPAPARTEPPRRRAAEPTREAAEPAPSASEETSPLPGPPLARPASGDTGSVDGTGSIDLSAFLPTRERAAGLLEPSASTPALPPHMQLDEGDRTELNAYRSMYWSFFQRVHQRIEQNWAPLDAFARHDPSFQLYGRQDRYTILRITLNSDGTLRHAVVDRSSELPFYDEEAIRTVRAAAPFLNVPEGLKDDNGQASFRFGFLFTFRDRVTRVRRLDGF